MATPSSSTEGNSASKLRRGLGSSRKKLTSLFTDLILGPKKIKEDLFKKHGKNAKNTGSAEGQIALFTFRINHLTDHLKKNKKDYNTERALVKLVGKRRALLDYLTKKDILRYRAIVKELGLRK